MPSSDFGPDGTQAPPPPALFPDPLAGLVTAGTWVAPQWTPLRTASFSSRVAVPTPPPVPTDELRQAIWAQMEQEERRGQGRRQRLQQHAAPLPQAPVAQPQQPQTAANSAATVVGCVIVLGFFVLVLVSILGAIFSG
ncbi:hypothetical protein [Lentzea guizhouensis]|uniref:hypothetical protein n=1 Tax=Lentzea guizhouensis TaxID=1586287 RepID=UPI0014764FA6|nr:hypothetical protein [Lentzea guizhouensis]